jgi:hypothetical protein
LVNLDPLGRLRKQCVRALWSSLSSVCRRSKKILSGSRPEFSEIFFEMKRRTNRPKNPRPRKRQRTMAIMSPDVKVPSYSQQQIRKIRVRYTTSNADGTGDVLTVTQLASMLGFTAISATVGYYWMSQFRLDKVEAWATPPAVADVVSIALKWADSPLAASIGIAGPPVVVQDSSSSTSIPAHIVLKPPRNSLFENWFGPNATPQMLVFTQQSTAGNCNAIIDFYFSFILDDIGTAPSFTIVGAQFGVHYHKIVTGTTGIVYTPAPPLNGI